MLGRWNRKERFKEKLINSKEIPHVLSPGDGVFYPSTQRHYRRLTLNICSFVHQCNTFTSYILLRHVSASHGHPQLLQNTLLQKLLLCYTNFRLCDVASHVLDMCFSWCDCCQCPSVNYIILCFVMLVIYQITVFMCLYLWYLLLCSGTYLLE
jgi:hypothetical protein